MINWESQGIASPFPNVTCCPNLAAGCQFTVTVILKMPRLISADKIVLLHFIFHFRDSSLTLLAIITCFVCVFKVNGNLNFLFDIAFALKRYTLYLGFLGRILILFFLGQWTNNPFSLKKNFLLTYLTLYMGG